MLKEPSASSSLASMSFSSATLNALLRLATLFTLVSLLYSIKSGL